MATRAGPHPGPRSTRNRLCSERDVLRGRALAVVHGADDRTVRVSGVFAARPRGPVGDPVAACGGQENRREQFPAVVGRSARRVEVLLANSRGSRVSLSRVRQGIVAQRTGTARAGAVPDELAHAWSHLHG